jgi:dihydropteroate synthase
MPASLDEILNSHRTHRPAVMGILNVTPDSFSDGGQFLDPRAAIAQARRMTDEGADIIDIGAESTRPGSAGVAPQEQIRRLEAVLPAAAGLGILVSIDTTSSAVAQYALDAGSAIINDISAGRDDPDMLPLAGRRGCPVVLMHMLGSPRTMQLQPRYQNVVGEVRAFLQERLAAARQAGIPREKCIIDPGIGFGKLLEHNLALLAGVDKLTELGVPVMVGASRKRFIAQLGPGGAEPASRLGGSIAACLESYRRGASIFRVHDVGPVVQALRLAEALARQST